eukprot:462393_1
MGCKQSIDSDTEMGIGSSHEQIQQNHHNVDNTIYVIGNNYTGALALNHRDTVKELTNWSINNPNINITNIYCGHSHIVYHGVRKKSNKKAVYWTAGSNVDGECCLGNWTGYIVKCQRIKHNIFEINKAFVSKNSLSVFWLSNSNEIYGNGFNQFYQLGIKSDKTSKNKPHKIEQLTNKNIIDIKSSYDYSVALTMNPTVVLKHWIKSIDFIIPDAVKDLIMQFCEINMLYMSINIDKGIWTTFTELENKNICAIECGEYHSLFLESNGQLWAYGSNEFGQLGVDNNNSRRDGSPVEIKWFQENKIKIKDIKCGRHHNLVIDDNDNIYSFGGNYNGQCGVGTHDNFYMPKKVESLMDFKIVAFDCGDLHSYALTDDGKHYMWGSNRFNECLVFNDKEFVLQPKCINETFLHKTNGMLIDKVYLGNQYTIIVSKTDVKKEE